MNELSTNVFDPDQILAQASMVNAIAASPLLPEHLRGRRKGGTFTEYPIEVVKANLMLVADAARVFKAPSLLMLAKSSFVIGSNLDFDGKVYASLANTSGFLKTDLDYEYGGKGMDRYVIVRGTLKGEAKPREALLHVSTGMAAGGKDSTPEWKNNPDQQLAYAGSRQWVRRHLAKVLLGFVQVEPDETHSGPIGWETEVVDDLPRLEMDMPTEDYKDALANLTSCDSRIQVEMLVRQIKGRNRMTELERESIRAQAREVWQRLPESVHDEPEAAEPSERYRRWEKTIKTETSNNRLIEILDEVINDPDLNAQQCNELHLMVNEQIASLKPEAV